MSATRLPGKPLLKLNGKSIISHVFKKAESAKIGEVVVAAEDKEILNDVKKNGGNAILTSRKHKTGTDRIELYTEEYAKKYELGELSSIEAYAACSSLANELEIGVNAGHDLSIQNIEFFAKNMPYLEEVSIGHALISESIYLGIDNVITLYIDKLNR